MGPLARCLQHLDVTATSAEGSCPAHHAKAHHEPVSAVVLSGYPRGPLRQFSTKEKTSFIFGVGEGKEPEKKKPDPDVEKLKTLGKSAHDNLAKITKFNNTLIDSRKELDAAITARYAEMQPLCKAYMAHRSELSGLAGAQCAAAQGRVNSEDLMGGVGPWGCLAAHPAGTKELGTPVVLHETRCAPGTTHLLCSERIAELARGDPAPGEEMIATKPLKTLEPGMAEHAHKDHGESQEGSGPPPTGSGGPGSENGDKGLPEPEEPEPVQLSMDQEFRKWCHPNFRLKVMPISESLSRGVLEPSLDDAEPVGA